MKIIDYYNKEVASGSINFDENQLTALKTIQIVFDELVIENNKRSGFRKYFHKNQLVKGIYLWGGVGIGKTYIMDLFYNNLPIKKKLRMHFHAFMRLVHDDLKVHQGEVDPLQAVADDIAKQAMVICFDELFVSDIGDAMLLGRLFDALFKRGITLVSTSNIAPDDLYKNGLQRLRFLPAIALIKKNTKVINIISKVDYRLRHLREAGVFYTPANQFAEENMQKTFEILSLGCEVSKEPIIVCNRPIEIKKQAGNSIWFEFSKICHIPRSQQDYLFIAEKYKNVFISNVPEIKESDTNKIRLFINLIDVLYDARVKLILSSEDPVEEIYSKGQMLLEFNRTQSRLLEMQSEDYFNHDF